MQFSENWDWHQWLKDFYLWMATHALYYSIILCTESKWRFRNLFFDQIRNSTCFETNSPAPLYSQTRKPFFLKEVHIFFKTMTRTEQLLLTCYNCPHKPNSHIQMKGRKSAWFFCRFRLKTNHKHQLELSCTGLVTFQQNTEHVLPKENYQKSNGGCDVT